MKPPPTASGWQDYARTRIAADPHFEERPVQDEAAAFLTRVLDDGVPAALEAGCGTGKSEVAIVPAVAHRRARGLGPVLVACSKLVQLDQYRRRTLPGLAEYLPGGLNWVVLKGRPEYPCAAKLADLPEGAVAPATLRALKTLNDDLTHVEMTWQEKTAVKLEDGECPGASSCPFADVCVYERKKEEAETADVVLCSHDLLVISQHIRAESEGARGILPEPGVIVIDEAHELADSARRQLGDERTQAGLQRLARQAAAHLHGDDKGFSAAVLNVFIRLESRFESELNDGDRSRALSALTELVEVAGKLKTALLGTAESLDDEKARRRIERTARMVGRAKAWADGLAETSWGDGGALMLYKPEHGGTITRERIDVAGALTELLWDAAPSVVMTATFGASFPYETGFPATGEGFLRVASPFDMEASALTILADAGRRPWAADRAARREGYLDYARRQLQIAWPLIEAAGGRTLWLAASGEDAELVAELLTPVARDLLGARVLVQRAGMNAGDRTALIREFIRDETSILIGLDSMAVGLDVPGPSLSVVVSGRYPYAPMNNPVVNRRSALLGYDVRDDDALLKIRQGTGRLIRSGDCRGVVLLLDPRSWPAAEHEPLARTRKTRDVTEGVTFLRGAVS